MSDRALLVLAVVCFAGSFACLLVAVAASDAPVAVVVVVLSSSAIASLLMPRSRP